MLGFPPPQLWKASAWLEEPEARSMFAWIEQGETKRLVQATLSRTGITVCEVEQERVEEIYCRYLQYLGSNLGAHKIFSFCVPSSWFLMCQACLLLGLLHQRAALKIAYRRQSEQDEREKGVQGSILDHIGMMRR